MAVPRIVQVDVERSGQPYGQFCISRSPASIGRDASADVRLKSPDVSRVHATMHVGRHSVRLVDAGSRNGFSVGGVPAREATIGRDDVVTVCDFTMRFRVLTSRDDIARLKLQVLDLSPTATWEDIRRAYRDLAQVWHPDRFAHNQRLQDSAQEKLKNLNDAYDWLKQHWRERSSSEEHATRAYEPRPKKAHEAAYNANHREKGAGHCSGQNSNGAPRPSSKNSGSAESGGQSPRQDGESSSSGDARSSTKADARLGGWLLLPAFGLILAPFRLIISMARTLGIADHLDTLGYAEFVAAALISDFVMLILCTYAAFMFFGKRREAPSVLIWTFLANAFAAAVVAVGASLSRGNEGIGTQAVMRLGGAVVGAAVWIPYFRLSRRVKATFTVDAVPQDRLWKRLFLVTLLAGVVMLSVLLAGVFTTGADAFRDVGTVVVTSSPVSDVQLYMDDEFVGDTTPMTRRDVALGAHTLLARSAGFREKVYRFDLAGGAPAVIHVEMEKEQVDAGGAPAGRVDTAWLSVLASPIQMTVNIMGREVGRTPVHRVPIQTGSYQLLLTNRAVGVSVTRSVKLAPGRHETVSVALGSGFFVVNASPVAWVKIGEAPPRKTPTKISLFEGTYNVVFECPKGRRYSKLVTVPRDDMATAVVLCDEND